MSPRKVRLVIDVVRGAKVNDALNQLKFVNKRATEVVEKLIKSAIANAVNTYELEQDNLFVKEIRVDEGATMKRWMPRARGRATPVRKRTSHIMLTLGEIVDSGEKKSKSQRLEAPISLTSRAKEAEGVKEEKKAEVEPETDEKGKKIVDPRGEGKGKNTKIEGKNTKGFGSKVFRRKSG